MSYNPLEPSAIGPITLAGIGLAGFATGLFTGAEGRRTIPALAGVAPNAKIPHEVLKGLDFTTSFNLLTMERGALGAMTLSDLRHVQDTSVSAQNAGAACHNAVKRVFGR